MECRFCGKDFKTFKGRIIHEEKQHPQYKPCPRCGKMMEYREFRLKGTFDGRDGQLHKSFGHSYSFEELLRGNLCDYSEEVKP